MADIKSEVEELINALLPVGQAMLQRDGKFIPCGCAMKTNGEIEHKELYDGEESLETHELIGLIKEDYQSSALKGEYKATAIIYDVRVTPPDTDMKTDAIAMAIDHKENYSIIMFFTYLMDGSIVKFGEMYAEAGSKDIF